MSVTVNFDEGNDLYELGADVDGVFVPFVTVPGSDARSRIEAFRQREPAPAAAPTTIAPTGETGTTDAAKDARIAELEQELADARGQTGPTSATPAPGA